MDKHQKEIEELRAQVASMAEKLKVLSSQKIDHAEEVADSYVDSADAWVKDVVDHLKDAGSDAKKKAQTLSKQAAEYVEENPWQVAAVAAAVAGAVVGVMMMNRKKE